MGQLPAATIWAYAKRELLAQLGDRSREEEAWNSPKQLSWGDKDIVDLGVEPEWSCGVVGRAFIFRGGARKCGAQLENR